MNSWRLCPILYCHLDTITVNSVITKKKEDLKFSSMNNDLGQSEGTRVTYIGLRALTLMKNFLLGSFSEEGYIHPWGN